MASVTGILMDIGNTTTTGAVNTSPRNRPMASDLVDRLEGWAELPAHVAILENVEPIFDQGNRHKVGAVPRDYLAAWLSMLRPFAYATKDDSWGEMEKLLCIVMRNYIKVRKDAGKAADRITQLEAVISALGKVMPIIVEEGPDYASVYFEQHSHAMTMNPQHWLDIVEALAVLAP